MERSALVTYGSETGNACDYAQELGQVVRRLRFITDVVPFDAIRENQLCEYTMCLVVVSTTGQGEIPLNARRFWKGLLRRKLCANHLDTMNFAAFGLGDSSYPKFNWAIRKIQKRLTQLGATELCTHGEADEQHPEGSDATFLPWVDGLRRVILQQYPFAEGVSPIAEDEYLMPKYQLVEDSAYHISTNGRPERQLFNEDYPHDTRIQESGEQLRARNDHSDLKLDLDCVDVTVQENRRLTPSSHWQDVRHLALVADKQLAYEPGDVLTIFPRNVNRDVDSLITLMQWTEVADKPLRLQPSDLDNRDGLLQYHAAFNLTQGPMTLRTLLTSEVDISAVPRRSFFAAIAHFARDETQKARILDFTNPEYADWLHDYATRPRRSILEVLHELDSVKIPWKWALSIFPPLRGRQFSIASGGHLRNCQGTSTSRFELLIAVVRYRTVIRKIRTGVCTRYLAQLREGSRLRVQLVKGSLGKAIQQCDTPVIMVGPGTGLAPLRSLIYERYHQSRNPGYEPENFSEESHLSAELALFFGARNINADYFYREEWDEIQKHLPLKVFTAFSRDQKAKIYVQDLIRSEASLVFRMLCEKQGVLIVCGSSGNMPKAVRQAVVDAFKTAGNHSPEEAEQYLQTMESQNRYKQETWS